MALKQSQIEEIQIDYGIVYANFGEVDEVLLGPTRGGGEFTATNTIHDIEHDGQGGKTKGMQYIEEINAYLKVTSLSTSMDNLARAMPYATYDSQNEKISCTRSNLGLISGSAYLKNIVMFAKTISGIYKKITLYNAMNESDFTLAATPKSEAEVTLEIYAHWDPTDDNAELYTIENVASIEGDVAGPTVVTIPADTAINVVVGADLTATFNEDIKTSDVNSSNFILLKATDGSIVPGALSYTAATKVVIFNPTADLEASTAYIWIISNVRDTSGNKMNQVAINFTTAA